MSAIFPVWNKNSPLADLLDDLAAHVRENPGRFERLVLCYRESLNGIHYRTLYHGCELDQAVGLFEIGKNETLMIGRWP